MLGSSRVAAQLAASREGLGSMSDDDVGSHPFPIAFQRRHILVHPKLTHEFKALESCLSKQMLAIVL
jgi:hypothetical protein